MKLTFSRNVVIEQSMLSAQVQLRVGGVCEKTLPSFLGGSGSFFSYFPSYFMLTPWHPKFTSDHGRCSCNRDARLCLLRIETNSLIINGLFFFFFYSFLLFYPLIHCTRQRECPGHVRERKELPWNWKWKHKANCWWFNVTDHQRDRARTWGLLDLEGDRNAILI